MSLEEAIEVWVEISSTIKVLFGGLNVIVLLISSISK